MNNGSLPLSRVPQLVLSGFPLGVPYVGQGVYTLRLAAALTKQPHLDFVVVTPKQVVRPPEISERNFVHLPNFRAPRNALINHTIASQHLLHFVRQEFPNAVFHSPGPIFGLTRPQRTVVTLHDCLYRHFPHYDGRFLIRRMLMRGAERFAAGASQVLTDSQFSRQDLIERARIPADKIEIVYPWVGNEFLQPIDGNAVEALRARLQLPERFWLYLGGYDYRKNVEFLLAAYAAGAQRTKLPPLVLAGDIPAKKNIATCDVEGALNRHRLTAAQVIQPGLIATTDLPALYRAAALLIYPSLGEGFGLPPAEAMAVGTPVLVSNATSLPEVVRTVDCLFDPRNADALVDKLMAAADNEKQFLAELSPTFTESHGIRRYLDVLGLGPND